MRQESQHIYDTMYTTRLENQNDTSLCEAGNFIEQNYCALATGSLEVGNRKQEETRRIYRFGYVRRSASTNGLYNFECYAKFARHSSYSHFLSAFTFTIIIRMSAGPVFRLTVAMILMGTSNEIVCKTLHTVCSARRFAIVLVWLFSLVLLSLTFLFPHSMTQKYQWMTNQQCAIFVLLARTFSFHFVHLQMNKKKRRIKRFNDRIQLSWCHSCTLSGDMKFYT